MAGYTVSAFARGNLAEIYAYSKRRWGEAQAATYLRELFEFFHRVECAEVPGRPVEVDEVQLRRANYRNHSVYWQVSPDGAVVIRAVLHGRMVQAEYLREAVRGGDDV